jgi:hypothetical protein
MIGREQQRAILTSLIEIYELYSVDPLTCFAGFLAKIANGPLDLRCYLGPMAKGSPSRTWPEQRLPTRSRRGIGTGLISLRGPASVGPLSDRHQALEARDIRKMNGARRFKARASDASTF